MQRTLLAILEAALDAAHPGNCLPAALPQLEAGRTRVIGAGKAAATMADALCRAVGFSPEGIVITRYGHGLPDRKPAGRIEILEAGHPVPDEAGLAATERVIALAATTGADEDLVFLCSGGGSALLVKPAPGITLADKQFLTRQLLSAGADIHEINCVRKHLSAVKGGRLANAAGDCRIHVLAISDVPGDCVADIASGPCTADQTTIGEARAVLERYGADVPRNVQQLLENPASETPKPGDAVFDRVREQLLATSADALHAAADEAAGAGYQPVVLGEGFAGDASQLGRRHARIARDYLRQGGQHALISGGETTVTVHSPDGCGGRNTEYLLALVLELDGEGGIHAIAADTDGIDGTGDHAGAWCGPDTARRARAAGLDGHALLRANRSRDYFSAVGALVCTGPTGTNVNDLRVVLVSSPDCDA